MATIPSGLDEYGQPIRRATPQGYQPAPQYSSADYNSSEPGRMSELDRNFAYNQGGAIDRSLTERAASQGNDEAYFRQKGMDLYGELEQTPGYTDAETQDILGKDGLDKLQYTPEMEQNLQLTEQEQNDIKGDPNKALDWYDPSFTQEIANNTSSRARGQFQEGASNTRGVGDAAAQNQRGVIDRQGLTFDPATGEKIQGAVDSTASNVRGAIDPNKLSVSQSYLDKYPMTDEQKEAMVGKSTRQIGTQYRGLQDDVELRAAQSGNASPAAVAAMKSRLANDEAINMADARANAEVGADAAQRATVQGAEDTRLGAEQNYAGMRSGAELSLGDQSINAGLATEKTRLGAAQALQGYLSDTERNVADQQIGIESQQQARGIETELAAGAQEQQANQANQKLGIDAYSQADETASNRAGQVATNRQNVTGNAQQQTYDRGMAINTATSNRTAGVADARRAGQAENRGYATGQQTQASNNVNTANAQRIDNYGTTAGAANNATRNKQNYELGKDANSWQTVAKGIVKTAATNFLKP